MIGEEYANENVLKLPKEAGKEKQKAKKMLKKKKRRKRRRKNKDRTGTVPRNAENKIMTRLGLQCQTPALSKV